MEFTTLDRLHTPMKDCLILTHGAGSNRDAPLLVALDAAFTAAGFEVLRVNLPFREARPSGPPRYGDPERDRQGLLELVQRTAAGTSGRVLLGGHSYGGRQASMLAAEHPGLVAGLLLLGYPLHPPRKPTEWRTAHFPGLRTPALFVHGSRDPFGSSEQLREAMALIPAPTRLVECTGAGHELARKPEAFLATASRILDAVQAFPWGG
jgi:uncharacterized protein